MNHDRDRYDKHAKHVEKLAAKHQTLEGKEALLAMWEKDERVDHEYLLGLRKRVRSLRCQLLAMKPVEMSRAGTEFD
jgi:hypothetical protein